MAGGGGRDGIQAMGAAVGRRASRRMRARLLRRQGMPELARPTVQHLVAGEGGTCLLIPSQLKLLCVEPILPLWRVSAACGVNTGMSPIPFGGPLADALGSPAPPPFSSGARILVKSEIRRRQAHRAAQVCTICSLKCY